MVPIAKARPERPAAAKMMMDSVVIVPAYGPVGYRLMTESSSSGGLDWHRVMLFWVMKVESSGQVVFVAKSGKAGVREMDVVARALSASLAG